MRRKEVLSNALHLVTVRAVGNSGSTVFKSNIPIFPAKAKRPTTIVMKLKKLNYIKMQGSC